MALFTITHKYLNNSEMIQGFQYLYVGAYRQAERRKDFIYDDDGDNISVKNSNYCELTGLYWIWKNSKDPYVGICHYRRFFTKNNLSLKKKYFYTYNELEKMLEKTDCLVADRLYVQDDTIYDHYARYHFKKDLDILGKLIEEEFPDYKDAFKDAFSKNYFYPCNMMFCKKELFDDYAKWLFDLMGKFESLIDISEYSTDQARIFGFLTERLLNVWIIKNNLKVKEVPMIQTDSSLKFRIHMILNKIFKCSIKEGNKYLK